jgi:hypothetical protein
MIYVINVDEGRIIEADVESYFKMHASSLSLVGFKSGIIRTD